MLTSAILLASAISAGASVDVSVDVGSAATSAAATTGSDGRRKKRPRRPRLPRSGMPSEDDDGDAPPSFKVLSVSGNVVPRVTSFVIGPSSRPGCPDATGTPRHLLLHVLLI